MLLNTKSLLIVTKELVFFFAQKSITNLPHQMFFLNGVRVQFLDQVKYVCGYGVWINASLKDDYDIQRQVKSLYCAANKLRGTFDQCSPAVKKHFISCLLHANVCLLTVEQIHADQYEALTCCI